MFKFNTFLLLTHNFTTTLRLHYNKVCFGDENATACTFNKCSNIVMVQSIITRSYLTLTYIFLV